MRIIFRLIMTVILVLYTGITYCQNDFVTLTSSDFIKGLDNRDFLREKLKENGYTVAGKSTTGALTKGLYEAWQIKTLLFVDLINNSLEGNIVKVAIHESVAGFPERLIQTFPHKENEQKNAALTSVNVKPVNKDISYSLVFPRDSDSIQVLVWYDAPYYFFQYKEEKKGLKNAIN
jgi:hypothetical protein